MAVASRKVRSIRRVKNKARLLTKQAKRAVEYMAQQVRVAHRQLEQTEYTLLTVLAQAGTVTVTTGTIENVMALRTEGRLRYEVQAVTEGDPNTEFRVLLIEGPAPAKPEPALTIRKVQDEEEPVGPGENDLSAPILEELVQQATEQVKA